MSLRRWRDTLWLTCGSGIVFAQVALADQVSLPLLTVGVSLVLLPVVLLDREPEAPAAAPAAADEHPLDRHVRIAGMLDDHTRQWLLDQAAGLPDGAVIHGMAVPAGYLVEVDPTSPADQPRLHLSLDNDHTPRVATRKIADGEVKAQCIPTGQFELTNAEYADYFRLINEAKEIQAMLALTNEAFEQIPDGEPAGDRLQTEAAGLRQALRDRQDSIRVASDSWRQV